MSAQDVLDWVDRRFVCGSLTVEHGDTVRTFQFDSGYVTGASSNDPAEHLGQLLIRAGHIDEETLNQAFVVQADTGVLLGKILLMTGAVNEGQLKQVMEHKIRDAVCDVLTWVEGTFQFERVGELPRVSEYEISVNLNTAIEYGQRRADEWREIREIIPSDDLVLRLVDADKVHRAGDSSQQKTVLTKLVDCVGRGMSVNQIVLESNGQRFGVASSLVTLVDRGALAVDSGEPEPAAAEPIGLSAGDLAAAARGRSANGDHSAALDLAREALQQAPDDPEVQKLFRELERSVFAQLSRDLLTTFRVPKLLKEASELEMLDLTDNERYLTGRIDGRWDLLSLMRVSPLREVEALITFKRLADRGIISL
jgi:hypothetical protein